MNYETAHTRPVGCCRKRNAIALLPPVKNKGTAPFIQGCPFPIAALSRIRRRSMIDSSSVRQYGDEPAIGQAKSSPAIHLRIALAAARAARDAPAIGQNDYASAVGSAVNGAAIRVMNHAPAVLVNGHAASITRSGSGLRRCRHRQPYNKRKHHECCFDLAFHCSPPLEIVGGERYY
jgi:hypothetical protein